MGKKEINSDTDITGIIQTDDYLIQDYPSGIDGSDQDGGEIYDDWSLATANTFTDEESPADQWHCKAGNAGGADSFVLRHLWGLANPEIPTATMQVEVKFDQLGTAYVGSNASLDCFTIQLFNGVSFHVIFISKDSVWYNDTSSVLASVQQFAYAFNNTSWWTIRVIFYRNSFTMWVKDNGGAWVLAGSGDDARLSSSFSGIYKLGVYNYPPSPTETEAHVKYCVTQSGAIYPT